MTQPDLPRRPPAHIFPLNLVPEFLADNDLKQRYEEMKQAFHVPWMGVVAMAFAHYRNFYDCLWGALREVAGSSLFVEGCAELRRSTEDAVAELTVARLKPRLKSLGYAPRELAEIEAAVEVFSEGNYPYLLLATTARHLLAGGALAGDGALIPAPPRTAEAALTRPVLMEEHHATAETKALYARIRETLDLPFVNTDYRAFARWPSYFAAAWEEGEPLIRTDAHRAICGRLHSQARDLVRRFPNPTGLAPGALAEAARIDAELDEVVGVTELFQWLLPQLCANVALFHRQLRESA